MQYFPLVGILLLLVGMSDAQTKEGTVVLRQVSDEGGFGNISLVLDMVDDGSKITMTKNSSSFSGTPYSSGKYELCFYQYGGVTRDLELGNLFTQGTFDGCVGGVVDTSLSFSTNDITGMGGPTFTSGVDTSLIGRAAVLCKRSVAVYTDTKDAQSITVQLIDADGVTVVDTETVTTATDYKTGATFVLDFPSNPTGTYKISVSSAASATLNLTIGEFTGSSEYWKSYMITDYLYSEVNAEAYPAFETQDYATLVADGWDFPTSSTKTPEISVDPSVLTHAAVGTIGIKKPASGTNEAGGPPADRIRCTFDDVWGTRTIYGQGLMTAYTSKFWLQAQISGLQCGQGVDSCDHSFHFHAYGDIDGGDGASEISPPDLGAIDTAYSLAQLSLAGTSSSVYYQTNVTTVGSFLDMVGLTLTVHDGPVSANATVAWGVCGVADPSACLRYGCPDVEYEVVDFNAASSKSVASLVVTFASILPLLYFIFE